MSKPHSDGGFPLPEIIEPETVKFCIEIPNETWHIRAFWGAMWDLTRWFNWQFDDNQTAKKVADVWLALYLKNHTNWMEKLCGGDMSGENCCDDQLVLQNKTNILLGKILTLLERGFELKPIVDAIDSIAFGTCLPDHFQSDGQDTGDDVQKRADVLCWVTQAYVYSVLFQNLALLGFPQAMISGLWLYEANNPFTLSKLEVNGSFLTAIVAAENIATTGTILDAMTCTMLAALTGNITSYAPFRDSVAASEDINPFVSAVSNMMYYANHQKDNYTLFCDALESQFNTGVPEGWTCPCVDAPIVAEDCDNLSLIDTDSTGCDFEYMGGCIWKMTQTATKEVLGITAHHFSFKDVEERPLYVSAPTDQATYPTQGVGGCEVVGACGSADYHGYMFGGGFAPTALTKVLFWQGTATVTYYKVELYVCP